MIPFALVLTLAPMTPAFKCPVNDAACWREAALAQQERAEKAEAKIALLEEAVAIGKRLLKEEEGRGDRWQKLAEKIAPKDPPVWERPTFWLALGFGLGAATTVGISYAVNHR